MHACEANKTVRKRHTIRGSGTFKSNWLGNSAKLSSSIIYLPSYTHTQLVCCLCKILDATKTKLTSFYTKYAIFQILEVLKSRRSVPGGRNYQILSNLGPIF